MSRWKKAVKVAAVTGAVSVGAGGYVLTKKMFVDRHAIVSSLLFFIFQIDIALGLQKLGLIL